MTLPLAKSKLRRVFNVQAKPPYKINDYESERHLGELVFVESNYKRRPLFSHGDWQEMYIFYRILSGSLKRQCFSIFYNVNKKA